MFDLVGKPEDRFPRDSAHFLSILETQDHYRNKDVCCFVCTLMKTFYFGVMGLNIKYLTAPPIITDSHLIAYLIGFRNWKTYV